MFELIGIVVTALVVWVIAKKVFLTGVGTTLKKAVEHAVSEGVPREYADEAIAQGYDKLSETRKVLAKANPSFSALDVYQQYGNAIIVRYNSDNVFFPENVKQAVKAILTPQMEKVECEKLKPLVNQATFVYVMALGISAASDNQHINTEQVRIFMRNFFTDKEHEFPIDNACNVWNHSSNLRDVLNFMAPTTDAEVGNGSGEYFVKLCRKGEDDLFSKPRDWDPADVDEFDFLRV